MRKMVLFSLTLVILANFFSRAHAEPVYIVPLDGSVVCVIDSGCTKPDGSQLGYDTLSDLQGQPTLVGVARAMMLEQAESILTLISRLTPADLLTESLARAAVRDLAQYGPNFEGMSYGAREEMFAQFQCVLFEHYPEPEQACWAARAFEGSEAEHVGIPKEIMPAISEMRTELYDLGRNYLAKPTNLQTTYIRFEGVMVEEFNHLAYRDQTTFIENMNAGRKTVSRFYEPVVQDAVKAYLAAELSFIISGGSSEDARTAFVSARDTLDKLVDRPWALFLARRDHEGGPALVAAYGEVIVDFITALTTK